MINITNEDIIEAAFQYYRHKGFPYMRLPKYQILFIFKQLEEMRSKIKQMPPNLLTIAPKNKKITIKSVKDQQLANHFHPHIWKSKAVGMRSSIQSYNIDKSLRKVMLMCLRYDGHIENKHVQKYLRTVNGTQICSNFRPAVAKAIYDYTRGEDVLDMSMGYGGRLLGFLASKKTGTYTGVDPSEKTYQGNLKIVKFFKAQKRVKLINLPFEDCTNLPKVDIAFTSPPYFVKEIYDENDKRQSRERYPGYKQWREKFLRVMIEKSIECLRPKGSLILNISDIKYKNKIIPLQKDTIKITKECGYKLVETLELHMARFGKGVQKTKIRFEPILVFKKN